MRGWGRERDGEIGNDRDRFILALIRVFYECREELVWEFRFL